MKRSGGARTLAATVAGAVLLLCGCAADPAEIPDGAGSGSPTAAPRSAAPAPESPEPSVGFDLVACIARSGFLTRPVAEVVPPDAEVDEPEVDAAAAQQLLEDQARFDAVAAACHAEAAPSPTP